MVSIDTDVKAEMARHSDPGLASQAVADMITARTGVTPERVTIDINGRVIMARVTMPDGTVKDYQTASLCGEAL